MDALSVWCLWPRALRSQGSAPFLSPQLSSSSPAGGAGPKAGGSAETSGAGQGGRRPPHAASAWAAASRPCGCEPLSQDRVASLGRSNGVGVPAGARPGERVLVQVLGSGGRSSSCRQEQGNADPTSDFAKGGVNPGGKSQINVKRGPWRCGGKVHVGRCLRGAFPRLPRFSWRWPGLWHVFRGGRAPH